MDLETGKSLLPSESAKTQDLHKFWPALSIIIIIIGSIIVLNISILSLRMQPTAYLTS
jgi:hypothetical protein